MQPEEITYRPGLTYICAAGCGTQITVNAMGDGGPVACCGQPIRRGRVLAVAPRQMGTTTPHPTTAYRLYATEADFAELVDLPEKLVLVEFSAPWCGACKAMDPVLDVVAAEFTDQVQLVEVDVDASPNIPEQFHVRSVPCLLFMRAGQETGKAFGQMGKARVVAELHKHLGGH